MKHTTMELSVEDRAELEAIVKKGRDWRVRDRAQTVLHFGDGWQAKAIAEKQELCARRREFRWDLAAWNW